MKSKKKRTQRKSEEWKFISEYSILKYACGLRAGQKLRLKRDINMTDSRGRPTGVVHRAGQIWTVLPGSKEPPIVVWLRQPDGESHTWDDNRSIFETFEIISL